MHGAADLLLIIDTGKGILKDKHDFVFERFTQLDDFMRGTGLGLPICRLLAEKFGGSLVIDADYTQRCCFVLRLPWAFQARLNTLSCPLHPGYKGRKLVKVFRVIQQTTQEGQGCRAIPFLSLYPRPGRLGNRRLK
mgnify:CR=1 FL=1